jgi:HSP20 family protein
MNVWTNEDGAVATAELPGFDLESIDISIVGDTLNVSGSREPEDVGEGRYHRRERGCGSFTRSFQLPFQVAGVAVEATFERGVLRIVLPRAEEDKPKKITVKAG